VKTKTFRLIGNTWVKSISEIKFCQFATASFNCGQLQTILFKDGLYGKAPLKFYFVQKCLDKLQEFCSNLNEIKINWVYFNNLNEI